MGRKKQEGLVKNIIVPHRMSELELEVLEQVGERIKEMDPLLRAPDRSEVIRTLLKLGLVAFEVKYGKIVLKREKMKKV